jgi:rhodanese-related sulfurtransferase
MFTFFKKLFKKTDYKTLVASGAQIIDVRSEAEYKSGHIKGSENIPLVQIKEQSPRLTALNCVLIVCCASGIQTYNGGAWSSLQSKI